MYFCVHFSDTGFGATGGFGASAFGATNNTGGLFGATQNKPGMLINTEILRSSPPLIIFLSNCRFPNVRPLFLITSVNTIVIWMSDLM